MTAAVSAPTADRVPVLMYHRVGETPSAAGAADARGYSVTPQQFAAQLDWLAAHAYTPCTTAAFASWTAGTATLPARSVLLTFDDGFEGLHTHAMPLLAARGWPATVFLVSRHIGGRDGWLSREFGAAGANPLLSRPQIMDMLQHGFDFQSHSRTHPDLTTLDDDALQQQLAGSRADLADLLGRPVEHVAYPFGRHDARVRRAVLAAGYRLAFSVNPGFNRPQGDALAVRRLDITGHDTPAVFGRKVALGSNDGSLRSQARYLVGRALGRLRGAG